MQPWWQEGEALNNPCASGHLGKNLKQSGVSTDRRQATRSCLNGVVLVTQEGGRPGKTVEEHCIQVLRSQPPPREPLVSRPL